MCKVLLLMLLLLNQKKDFEEFKTNKAKFAQTVIDNIFAKYYASTLKSIGITSMITTEKQFHPDLFSNYLKLAVDKFKSPKLALTILQAYEIYTAALRKFKVDSSEKRKKLWLSVDELPPKAKAMHQLTVNLMEDMLASVDILEDISDFADTARLNILKSTLLMLKGESMDAYLDRSPTLAYVVEKEQKENRWLEYEGGESEEVTWSNFWVAAEARHHDHHDDKHAKDTKHDDKHSKDTKHDDKHSPVKEKEPAKH